PTTGQLRLRFTQALPEAVQLQLIDVLGQELLRREVPKGSEQDLDLDLQQLPAGSYWLRIAQEGYSQRIQIIKI
ncbi:MAG: T9SS type A sorting domain-containing protein, partial [Bacteroidota bacterium]